MKQYRYCAYYDGTPTISGFQRSMKSEDEIQVLLAELPSRLEYHCADDAQISPGAVGAAHVSGPLRLTRTVTISTALAERDAIARIEMAFKDLDLFGQRVL